MDELEELEFDRALAEKRHEELISALRNIKFPEAKDHSKHFEGLEKVILNLADKIELIKQPKVVTEKTTINQITNYLESLVTFSTQESYDNCGLLVGDYNQKVSNILVSLDCTEDIVDEAIQKKCELIISHHSISLFMVIFSLVTVIINKLLSSSLKSLSII
jgi:hypothetical protein